MQADSGPHWAVIFEWLWRGLTTFLIPLLYFNFRTIVSLRDMVRTHQTHLFGADGSNGLTSKVRDLETRMRELEVRPHTGRA